MIRRSVPPRSGSAVRGPRRRCQPRLDAIESRLLLSTFTVTSVADSGAGSLRQAINAADAAGGTNTIAFDIPGSGPQVITPLTALPSITSPVTIDGYTQPGSSPNASSTGDNAVPRIVIDGSQITAIQHSLGLQVKADNSTVQGLVIRNFGGIGVVLSGSNDVLQGDFIGTDPTGKMAQPNSLGVGVIGAGATIGGTTPAARDLVSGNDVGIGIASLAIGGSSLLSPEAGSVVEGDLIGTDATGSAGLGNSIAGVALAGSGNVVGGTAAGQANTIAFNGQTGAALNIGVGVVVVGLSPSSQSPVSVLSTGNLISGNAIYGNHDAGIGLLDIPTSTVLPLLGTSTANIPGVVANFLSTVNLGVTPDDHLDTDVGPNNLQNFPVLASAVTQGGATTVRGTLDSTPNTSFQVQFFSNTAADASGYGEGRTYLGQTTATTDANGLASIAFTPSTAVPVGQVVTATTTDSGNNTSEFSRAVAVVPQVTTTGPHVVTAQGFVTRARLSSIVLTFSGPLAPAGAQNVGNYSLFLLKKVRHSHVPKQFGVPIGAASYDATASTVTLIPGKKLKAHGAYSLTVNGTGLTDLDGNPLAGGSFTTILGPPIKAPKGG